MAPFLVLVMIPRWIGIPFEPFTWLAVFPISAIPLTWLAALKGYRLWDLEPISRDSLSATLVVVTGGFIFALTNHLLLRYTGGVGSLRNLFAFATGVLLVVLLQPVRLRVEKFLDQWLHQGRPAPRSLLTGASRELARRPRGDESFVARFDARVVSRLSALPLITHPLHPLLTCPRKRNSNRTAAATPTHPQTVATRAAAAA